MSKPDTTNIQQKRDKQLETDYTKKTAQDKRRKEAEERLKKLLEVSQVRLKPKHTGIIFKSEVCPLCESHLRRDWHWVNYTMIYSYTCTKCSYEFAGYN